MIDPFTDVKPWIRTTSHGGALLPPLIRKDLHCVPQSLLWFSLIELWAQQFKYVLPQLERDPALTEAYICATFTKHCSDQPYMGFIQKLAALSSQVSPIWSKRSDMLTWSFFSDQHECLLCFKCVKCCHMSLCRKDEISDTHLIFWFTKIWLIWVDNTYGDSDCYLFH